MEYEDLYRQSQSSNYDCLLFDLDDTLYPFNSGLAVEVRKNIHDYMVEKLGLDKSIISDLSNALYKNYGTTMAGLRAVGYSFDYDEYHSVVHGRLPYDKLKPDPILRHLLLTLPFRKVIFTNSDKVHAAKVLNKLGLEDCFEGIICFETLNPTNGIDKNSCGIFDILGAENDAELPPTPVLCKPSRDAMDQALKIANVDPHMTIFFDDSIRNLRTAKEAGVHTVLVGTSTRAKGADCALESIHNIREALPELWVDAEHDNMHSGGPVAIETTVTA